jgi:ectoine utilization protein EutC
MSVTILRESEIRRCVAMTDESINAVSFGFTQLQAGKVSLPPIISVLVPQHRGEVDIKTAYIQGLDNFAIKVASGFFDNPTLGLPYGSGMMVLMSARTGFLEALLLDNGYLTDLRTGIAGAIVAQHLAPSQIETAGVIGSGMQARYQVRGLKMVRNFHRLLVYGIDADGVERYVQEMTAELGVEVRKAGSPEEIVRQSQFVACTTPSEQPYIEASWLHPRLHISAVGADSDNKQELHSDVFSKADRLFCDVKDQCFRRGELHHALDAGILTTDSEITELGELTSGAKMGRKTDDEITICDLTGVGVQDTTIAVLTYQKALAMGLGASLEV